MYIAYKFLKRGAKIYLYDGGFNHAKVMSVDGNLLTIGSANLDARSLCFDYENNLFVFGEESVAEFLQYYNEDKRESRLMTRDDWKKISPWRKFVGWLGNLITPFL
jgi:cardiolipin synthase